MNGEQGVYPSIYTTLDGPWIHMINLKHPWIKPQLIGGCGCTQGVLSCMWACLRRCKGSWSNVGSANPPLGLVGPPLHCGSTWRVPCWVCELLGPPKYILIWNQHPYFWGKMRQNPFVELILENRTKTKNSSPHTRVRLCQIHKKEGWRQQQQQQEDAPALGWEVAQPLLTMKKWRD